MRKLVKMKYKYVTGFTTIIITMAIASHYEKAGIKMPCYIRAPLLLVAGFIILLPMLIKPKQDGKDTA